MSDAICTLGIDPGGTSGILVACWQPGARKASLVRAFQVNMDSTVFLLELLLCEDDMIDAAQIENYDRRGTRTRGGPGPAEMRALITELELAFARHDVPVRLRYPGQVKPRAGQSTGWATDERLARAGLDKATAGMRHAADAGRHALYTACKDLGMRDPKSSKWGDGHAPPDG